MALIKISERRKHGALRRASVAAAVLLMMVSAGGVSAGAASADPVAPAPPMPVPRPMPADPGRVNPIGGARISSTTPQGETAGMEQPLAAARELSTFTVPMWAKDGIFFPTTWAARRVALHLPGEVTLQPAAWSGDGGATYGSNDVDYQVIPFAGGGGDIVIHRKTIFSPSDLQIGVKLPEGAHLRQGTNVILVETDPRPGASAAVIGTFSIPVARDSHGAIVNVTPGIGPGFPNQTNVLINLGPADIFAFPVDITVSYRASNISTTGALTSDWNGMPGGAKAPVIVTRPADYVTDPDGHYRPTGVDPALYAQRHSGGCNGGPNEFRSVDGRTADFVVACLRQQMCLDASPADTSVDVCNNVLFTNMSTTCVTTFGQTGDDYDACEKAASDEVAWVKANMLNGPLCQPAAPPANTALRPSNGNTYCSTTH
ncbi:Uncharacterised protein [Mycobacteroides abscessus subsp. massiliense]|nr:Uncharacterised protein [Mycobacteroides abscessus subsp. massiliense]SKU02713.1 Uncharacterised protein [Mycobacteroides abscessus subsp. massiliense]